MAHFSLHVHTHLFVFMYIYIRYKSVYIYIYINSEQKSIPIRDDIMCVYTHIHMSEYIYEQQPAQTVQC